MIQQRQGHSASLVVVDFQIKTTVKYYFMSTRRADILNSVNTGGGCCGCDVAGTLISGPGATIFEVILVPSSEHIHALCLSSSTTEEPAYIYTRMYVQECSEQHYL